MQITSIVLDILAVVFALVVAKIAARQGFIRTIVRLVGFVLSLVFANVLSKYVSEFVFKEYVRNSLVQNITEQIASHPTVESFLAGLEAFFDSIPALLLNALEYAGVNFTQSIDSVPANIEQVATTVVDSAVAPTLIALFATGFFFLFFALFRFLFKILARSLTATIRHIPLVGTANTILGGCVGLVEGVLYLYLVVMIMSFVMALTGDSLPVINTKTLEETWILSIFLKNNPLGSLILFQFQSLREGTEAFLGGFLAD